MPPHGLTVTSPNMLALTMAPRGQCTGLLFVALLVTNFFFFPHEELYSLTQTLPEIIDQIEAAQCVSLFFRGIEPISEGRPEKDPSLNLSWDKMNCDARFCHDERPERGNCTWTSFAINTLIEKGSPQCTSQVVDSFESDPRWAFYRFSDYFWQRNVKFHPEDFNGTIMAEYYRVCKEKYGKVPKGDYGVLNELVQTRAATTNDIPPPNTAVIHLRLGDVVEASPESIRELLFKQHFFYRLKSNHSIKTENPWEKPHLPQRRVTWNAYVRPLSYFSAIDWTAFQAVVIMGSAHLGDEVATLGITKPVSSCEYTMALKAYIERFGVKVSLRLGMPPEDDVVFASKAAVYVRTGGGYSETIATLVRKSGGEVIYMEPTEAELST